MRLELKWLADFGAAGTENTVPIVPRHNMAHFIAGDWYRTLADISQDWLRAPASARGAVGRLHSGP